MTAADDDAEIRRQLLLEGDDGKAPRHTLFYFYGGDIQRLEQAARSNDFVTDRMAEDNGLILEKTLAVDEVSFAPVNAMMKHWAKEFGTEFDGWECAVV
jgi:hypothetical protein